MWNDEMFSLDVSSSALSLIQQKLVAHYHHPPLFFVLAHAALQLFGYSAWALRSTSALFGSLTVGLVFVVATRLFRSRLAGLAAGGFCLLSPFHIAYSQEGRPYALAGFLCLLSAFLLYRYLERRSPARGIAYAAATVLLLYTHHWGLFVAAGQCIVVSALLLLSPAGSWPDERETRRRTSQMFSFIPVWLAMALCYVPEALALRGQFSSSQQAPDGWFWVRRPEARTLVDVGLAFGGTYFKMASSVFDSPGWAKLCSLAALGALLAIVAWKMTARGGKDNPAPLRLLAGVGALSLLVPFALAFLRPEIFLWYRYTLIGFPLFCVCLGAAAIGARNGRPLIGRERARAAAAWAALAVGITLGGIGTVRYFSWQKANIRAGVAFLEQAAERDGAVLLIRPRSLAPLVQYYYRGNIAQQYDEAYLDRPLGDIVDTARCFAYLSLDVPNSIRIYMDRHFDKVEERTFPGEAHMGIVVGVYRQHPDPDQ